MAVSSTTVNYFCLLHCGGRPEGPEPLPSRDINFPPAGRQKLLFIRLYEEAQRRSGGRLGTSECFARVPRGDDAGMDAVTERVSESLTQLRPGIRTC